MMPHASVPPPADRAVLPVQFFTIVLNGEPFIRYHIDIFSALPFEWHWHIVEGVASLTHDTAWSVANGGRVTNEFHRNGLSCDGTAEYLNELAQLYPGQITIYRKKHGEIWDGKLEMVNAPLAALNEECLLWQVDADELWTPEQIRLVRHLFVAAPKKTAAFFYCNFFVGENLLLTTRGTYGNNPTFEWLRCWRFTPGSRWFSHEPPRLCRKLDNGSWVDVAAINPLSHAETEAYGLRFQHFAYATHYQLRFKEVYYGYRGAVERWEALQSAPTHPVSLREFFPWVSDETIVDTATSQNVKPIAHRDCNGRWNFLDGNEASALSMYSSFEIMMRRNWFRLVNFAICTRHKGKSVKEILLQKYNKCQRSAG